jgi:hypothetical protein
MTQEFVKEQDTTKDGLIDSVFQPFREEEDAPIGSERNNFLEGGVRRVKVGQFRRPQ